MSDTNEWIRMPWSRAKLGEYVPALSAFDDHFGNTSVVAAIVARLNSIQDAMRAAGYEPDQVDTRAPMAVQMLQQHIQVLGGSATRTAAGLRAQHRNYKRADKDRTYRDLRALAHVLRAAPGQHGGPHGGYDYEPMRSQKQETPLPQFPLFATAGVAEARG